VLTKSRTCDSSSASNTRTLRFSLIVLFSRGCRHGHGKARSPAQRAVHVDAPAVSIDDPLDDRKPEAGALLAAGRPRAQFLEGPEKKLLILRADARSLVLHA